MKKEYEINWKSDLDQIVYGKTLDEVFEEMKKECPCTKNAWDMLCVMSGYLGTKGAPAIDAGIFLKKFCDAVADGRIEWNRR